MRKFRRFGAILAIVLLLSLYLICFISAISGGEKAQTLFRITLGLTVALPIVLYAFILFIRLFKSKEERAAALFAQPPAGEPAEPPLAESPGETSGEGSKDPAKP